MLPLILDQELLDSEKKSLRLLTPKFTGNDLHKLDFNFSDWGGYFGSD